MGRGGGVDHELRTLLAFVGWVASAIRVEDAMATDKKILNLHEELMDLSREKYNLEAQGKDVPANLGSSTFLSDLFTFIGDWEHFLVTRQKEVGDQFLMFTAGWSTPPSSR